MSGLTFGLMWHNAEGDTYKQAIAKAARYYKNKYGQQPTHCVVNDKVDAPKSVNKISVSRLKAIRPKHVFIGVKEAKI